jgi:hypothetical protein
MENVLKVPNNILFLLRKTAGIPHSFGQKKTSPCSNAQTLRDDVTSEEGWYGAQNRHLKTMHHPTNVFRDTSFMTYINCYMFRHRGAILRESL